MNKCKPLGSGRTIVHPAVASVLYLGDAGGATAVFGQAKTSFVDGNADSKGSPGTADDAQVTTTAALSPRLPIEAGAYTRPLFSST